jgi:hypothetical protein
MVKQTYYLHCLLLLLCVRNSGADVSDVAPFARLASDTGKFATFTPPPPILNHSISSQISN